MVLVAAVLAVLVLPGLLDWTRYRGTIEALASSSIGRLVRIEGGVSLSLLPQPVLTAERISVADTGDGLALAARQLRLRIGLGGLLSGRLDPRELTLRGAELRLPWPLAPGALTQPPAWLSDLQARVEDSQVQIGGFRMTGIDAGLGTDRDTGSLAVAGVGQYAARAWHFTARLGQIGRDGSATVEASVDGQGTARDTGAAFSGQLGGDGALSGRVSGRGPDLSQILPTPAVAWRAEGRLLVQGGLAIADELALQIGGSPARGAVALRVGSDARLDLAVAASQLDLDAWLPVLVRGAAPPLPTSLDLSAEAATLAGGILRHLRGAFDLSAGGVAVREVAVGLPGEAQLSLAGHIVRVPAVLPAGQPAGSAMPAATQRFEGKGRLAAPDLRTTLHWLEPLLPALLANLPPGVLRTAQFDASISAEPGQIALQDVAGTVDGSRVSGGASLRLAGARPHLGTGLTLDALALDDWLPEPQAFLLPATLAALPGRLAALDLELRLEARRATWQGRPLSGLALDLQTEQGRLTIRRLDARSSGVRLSAVGAVMDAGRLEGRIDLEMPDAATLQPVLAASLPAWWQPGLGLLRGQGSAQVTLSGLPEALALHLTAELGDLRLEMQPTVDMATGRWAGSVAIRHPGAPRLLEGMGIPATAAWLGDGSFSLLAQVDSRPQIVSVSNFDVSAGSLRASGQLVLDRRNGPNLTGKIAAEALPLPLPYPYSPEPMPVALLRGWRAAIGITAQRVLAGLTPIMEGVTANLALESGTLRLHVAAGTLPEGPLSGGALSGTAALDGVAEPPLLAVQGRLDGASVSEALFDLPLDVAAARQVDARLDLAATGHSPAGMLATLSGNASVLARDATVSGFDLASAGAVLARAQAADAGSAAATALDSGLRAALAGGSTAADRLELGLRLAHGVVQLDGSHLGAAAGTVTLAGSLDLQAGTIDLQLGLRPVLPGQGAPRQDAAPDTQLPGIGLGLAGPPTAPRRTPDLAGALRWLADRPAR